MIRLSPPVLNSLKEIYLSNLFIISLTFDISHPAIQSYINSIRSFKVYNKISQLSLMIANHQHILDSLKTSKRRVQVTESHPLILVCSKQFSFLNYFTQSVLRYEDFNFVVKYSDEKQLMDYQLPILCFEDVIIEKQALIEFLTDVSLGELDAGEYFQRKQNFKSVYKSWCEIFHYQRDHFFQKGDLSIVTRDDLTNSIFQNLITFSSLLVNHNYQKIYKSYAPNEYNIEAILLVDITETIINNFKREQCEYILRGYFDKQIDFAKDYKETHDQQVRRRPQSPKIVLMNERQEINEDWKLKSTNLKWSVGILVGLSFIFGKWAK